MRRKSVAEVLAADDAMLREEVYVPERDSAEFDMGDTRDRVHILHTMLAKRGQYFTFGVSYSGQDINDTKRLLETVAKLNRCGMGIGEESEHALYGVRMPAPEEGTSVRYLEIFRR